MSRFRLLFGSQFASVCSRRAHVVADARAARFLDAMRDVDESSGLCRLRPETASRRRRRSCLQSTANATAMMRQKVERAKQNRRSAAARARRRRRLTRLRDAHERRRLARHQMQHFKVCTLATLVVKFFNHEKLAIGCKLAATLSNLEIIIFERFARCGRKLYPLNVQLIIYVFQMKHRVGRIGSNILQTVCL